MQRGHHRHAQVHFLAAVAHRVDAAVLGRSFTKVLSQHFTREETLV
ncbi:MAG: hypothetical protein U0610_08790 [bacterium]